MQRIYLDVYLAGYGGWVMPRWLRRLIAGTELHRAWVLGFNGYFKQDGDSYCRARPPVPAPSDEDWW
jgi:hypothetical protein